MQENDKQLNSPQREEKILEFWGRNRIFEKSLKKTLRQAQGKTLRQDQGKTLRQDQGKTLRQAQGKTLRQAQGKAFVFYEGPPTANAAPGIHHVEARSFKDVIPRYKTMRGFHVPRKAGWDTHGLPVEIQVEKALGLKTKKDIEKYGIAEFNKKCRESVWQFKGDWERVTKRIGFWLDLENPYITYEAPYMESLWWIIKQIWKKGLLYRDFKILPWCPRCETGLSSHELALGYKKVREDSIFVRFKIKGRGNEYVLIWTTTPWTLPGNVAVALNPKIDYTKWKVLGGKSGEGAYYAWSAVAPPFKEGEKVEFVEKVSGRSLLGLTYEPLYYFAESNESKKFYKLIPADFIETEEGTGFVHIAPAFGEDDMNAVKKEYGADYPIIESVNVDGTMKRGFIGAGKFVKSADKDIIADLERRALLYKAAPYEHDYPFCWRCATPLLYFAKNSWWIRMTELKQKLIKNNSSINWTPEHLKEGRFGEFLREVRDWAFSRERFWGTPLPIWVCGKCFHQEAIGSRDDLLKFSEKAKNRYLIMRHGEAETNVRNIVSYSPDDSYGLTDKGRVRAKSAAKKLKKEKIDLIFHSDIFRTKETAEIVAGVLGLSEVRTDKRLREINTGVFGGRNPEEYQDYYLYYLEKFTKRPLGEGAENLSDLRRRMTDFLMDMEKKYSGKTILIISHEYPLWMMYAGAQGLSDQESLDLRVGEREEDFVTFAKPEPLVFKNLPRDESGAINLHRPYTDDFLLDCPKCGGKMKRVPDVIDVWFDSGAMPFAQDHWPFAADTHRQNAEGRGNRLRNSASSRRFSALRYPADYISEAVDQTRGWFYTLLAVATLLGKKAPYKNVISLGHVLDKNGQKMSKSKGNMIIPDEIINKYGADAVRWYFYTINSPGDPKKFDEKDLQQKLRGFLGTLWNSLVFFDTYVDKIRNSNIEIRNKFEIRNSKDKKVLDQWIIVKVNNLIIDVTKKLDAYDITGAARSIEEFTINDFSNWYLRRSRRRFQKPKDKKEKNDAAAVTADVLMTLAKLAAPFVPFISEALWQELRKKLGLKEESVHLAVWPVFGKSRIANRETKKMLIMMEDARSAVAEALKQRAEAGIKVRQPLAKLQITNHKLQKSPDLLNLIREEVNVKKIAFGKELKLDTAITAELKEEGVIREVIRNIQEMRKDLGLHPRDRIRVQFSSVAKTDATIDKWKKFIVTEAGAKEFYIGGKKIYKAERDLNFDGLQIWVGVDKVK